MSPDDRVPPPAARVDWVAAGAVFLAVLAARLWLLGSAGSALPYWDQWDAEALGLYRPWLTGNLDPAALLAPHNEHRIVLTRLLDLALFATAGGWNPWGQLLINAGLHAAAAALLAVVLPRPAAAGLRPLVPAGVALLLAVPAGWQNALWGFQSQVHFSTLLAVGALAGLAGAPAGAWRWWIGWFCAALAPGATGGGPLVAIAALPFVLLAVVDRRSDWWRLVAVGAVLAAGVALQVTVPAHAALRAADATQFLSVFLHALAWPWIDTPALALAMQAPACWLLFRLARSRRLPDGGERLLLALLLWSWLHAAAIAFSRGAGLPEGRPLSRYQDPLVVGVVAQCAILLRLVAATPRARIPGLLWGGCLLAGLLLLSTQVLSVNLPHKRRQDRAALAAVRAYLSTGDFAAFAAAPAVASALHPDPAVVRQVLDDATLRPRLPREFIGDQSPPWLVRHGAPVMALAAALLALTPRLRLRTRFRPQTGRTAR